MQIGMDICFLASLKFRAKHPSHIFLSRIVRSPVAYPSHFSESLVHNVLVWSFLRLLLLAACRRGVSLLLIACTIRAKHCGKRTGEVQIGMDICILLL